MQFNDIKNELSQNFLDYAMAVNTDRAIPDARDGLKPVAKRILYGTFSNGFSSAKPHVKSANIVGRVMADLHPHGDTSIYDALVRLSQEWIMRYPLMDFHGNKGNRDGDGPASYRYTETRLSKIAEDGMLCGIKKKNVDFIPNYQETDDEPVVLPSLFPNLLCNPNSGIGVAIASGWAPHNLIEVETAINDYIAGKEPMLPGPDFPTGGEIINSADVKNIMLTGKGSVKIRARYRIENNQIVYYELPYGVKTEDIMEEIGKVADEKIPEIDHIRNESNKKGFRLVVECERGSSPEVIANKLFKETDLETSFSYNQVALVNNTPVENLSLKDCIKIYIDHNTLCITREAQYDIEKTSARLHIIEGLLKALEDIDNIIQLIKSSKTSTDAKIALMNQYSFSEEQAKAILDMKLSRLASLEKVEIENEKTRLLELLEQLNAIIANPVKELQTRLRELVKKYGDPRRTILSQIVPSKDEDKEIAYVMPEECVVILTSGGLIKRIPKSSFKTQKRGGKGIKTQDDITKATIRTNTIDNLLVFSNKGRIYKLLVDKIPIGTNVSKGVPVSTLVKMEPNEAPAEIYSQYRGSEVEYLFIATKNGQMKKTLLSELLKSGSSKGSSCINLKDGDEIAAVTLMKNEQLLILTEGGMIVRISSDFNPTGKTAMGIKAIGLKDGDKVIAALPIRNEKDELATFTEKGLCKRTPLYEFVVQGRGGKGVIVHKLDGTTGPIAAAQLVNESDTILVVGSESSICFTCSEIPIARRNSSGSLVIKNNKKVLSVTKV